MINTNKAKVMLVISRQKQSDLSLNFIDAHLQLSSNENNLGAHVEENLLGNGHFQHISKKIASGVLLLSQINSLLSDDDKMLFYKNKESMSRECYADQPNGTGTMLIFVIIWNISVSSTLTFEK